MLLALVLAGCGGGGGDGSASSNSPQGGNSPVPAPITPVGADNSWLQLTPSSAELSHYEGEPVTLTVNAKSTKTIAQAFNVGIVDAAGVVDAKVSLTQLSPYEYNVQLSTAKTLKAGTHQTTVEVRLCEDDPLVCARPISGSPWKLPLKVVVKPLVSLAPVDKMAHLGAWTTFQGNTRHSGYVPLSVNPVDISRRWNLQLSNPQGGVGLPSIAVENGQVFFTTREALNSRFTLHAIDESTGKQSWSTQVVTQGVADSPAVAQGLVVLRAESQTETGGSLMAYDQKTGALVRKIGLPPRPHFMSPSMTAAPTPVGDTVFVSSATGMASYNLTSGALQWKQDWEASQPSQTPYESWTPSVDGGTVYVGKAGEGIGVFDAASGAKTGWPAKGSDGTEAVPVLSGSGIAYVMNHRNSMQGMRAYDVANNALLWSAGTDTAPVTNGKIVYLHLAGTVEARDARTGAVLWTLRIPSGTYASNGLLLTDTLLFVSSSYLENKTFAIDLAKRSVVWTHPQSGTLAISDRGLLYILTHQEFSLQAFNLR